MDFYIKNQPIKRTKFLEFNTIFSMAFILDVLRKTEAFAS